MQDEQLDREKVQVVFVRLVSPLKKQQQQQKQKKYKEEKEE